MEVEEFAPLTTLWQENTSIASNSSDASLHEEWALIYAIIPPYIFTLCLFGLLFNAFVLLVYLIHKDRLTVAEIYLSNLALADFVLLCGLPFWAMNILNQYNWPYGEALCKLVNSAIVVNFYTSSYTLVMISVDRYLALVKTMEAARLRRTLYAKVICLLLWLWGLLLSTPNMLHRKVKFIEELRTTACVLDYSHGDAWKLAHQVLMNVVGFLVPFLVILFSSVNILRSLSERRESSGFRDINDRKATVLVYAVTLVFLLCWGPFQVVVFLDILSDAEVLDEAKWYHALNIAAQVSVYLAFLNSALNPMLYVFSGQYFQRKVRDICRRTRHSRRGSDMTTFQRSVVLTYINRTEQIKTVFIPNEMVI